MNRRNLLAGIGAGAIASAMTGLEVGAQTDASVGGTVYELRVYHLAEGKLDLILARFRDHTIALFNRHGIKSVAYWSPMDEPLAGRTIFYMLEHPSREQAEANWKSFRADPEWKTLQATTEADGKWELKIETTFLKKASFSPGL
jgi:NIPSNAP